MKQMLQKFNFAALNKVEVEDTSLEQVELLETENTSLGQKSSAQPHSVAENATELTKLILRALGGKENLISIDACVTRLRLEVRDMTAVNDKAIKAAGVAGVIKPGKTSVQVIVGTKVQFVADAFSKLCE